MNKSYPLIALLSVSLVCAFTHANAQATSQSSSVISSVSESYLDRLINMAKTNYPRVKANAHRVNAAKANVNKTKISWFDSFTFSYLYSPNNNNTTQTTGGAAYTYFNGLQAGLYVNLGSLLEKPASIKQAKEELGAINSEQQEYLGTLEYEVRSRYYTYLGRLQSVKNVHQAVLDANNLTQDLRHRYEKGEETFENYLRAQAQLSQQNESMSQAETNLLIAKAALEQMVGDKLENIK